MATCLVNILCVSETNANSSKFEITKPKTESVCVCIVMVN